ncbi:MAG: glycosyltransferase [Bacteroidales bacterium]|jgi:glycosyltransferase involved in cell wall biosynthesis|nr:glycosyltransferase [Bacteroidales bacterium]
MRVALIGRTSLHAVTGGDTIQMVKTAGALKKLGVQAEIMLASGTVDYSRYDLLHFFNLLRPADHLRHIRNSKKPYVISTIYLDYTSFDRYGRSLPYRLLFRALGRNGSEYFKNLYRYARGQDRMVSPEYLAGHSKAMLAILEGAALILPNSASEYSRLMNDTGFRGEFAVIPNGIDPEIFGIIPPSIKREDIVMCVGQIYGMKNQHLLIRACEKLKVPLKLIGKAPPNHSGYYQYCRKIAGKNVTFFDFMPQDELIRHYAGARVHALPSWSETTGLSSLEAAAMGCNLVVGKGGDTSDYFRDLAWYCDARDQESLVIALGKALEQQNGTELRDLVMTKYTWQKAAEKTKDAYEKVLHG